MVGAFAKASPRWQEGGGELKDLIAVVVQASDEFGPAGLRGAMSEVLREADKGLIPVVASILARNSAKLPAPSSGRTRPGRRGATRCERRRMRRSPTSARRVTCWGPSGRP